MNTPRLLRLLLVLAQSFSMLGQGDTGVKSTIRYDAAVPTNPIVLSWPSSPGSTYLIKAAPVLGSPWEALTASPLLASTNLMNWNDAADQRSRFYQVLRLEGNLTLQGQVTDALNGSPLAGATVMAGGLMALTDTNGIYAISNLSAGSMVADFAVDVRSGKAPLTVRFQSLSTATPAVVTVAGNKPGYFSYTNAQVGLTAMETNRLDFSLSPVFFSVCHKPDICSYARIVKHLFR